MLLQFCFLQVVPSKQLPSANRDTTHPSLAPSHCWQDMLKLFDQLLVCPSLWPMSGTGESPLQTPHECGTDVVVNFVEDFFSCPNVHETAEIPRKHFVTKIRPKIRHPVLKNSSPQKRKNPSTFSGTSTPLTDTRTQRPGHKLPDNCRKSLSEAAIFLVGVH